MPNQINSKNLLNEQSQAWLDSSLKHTRYCHFFAICIGDNKYPMGDWNAPFYSIEEAHQFKEAMQAKYPNEEFYRIEGILHVDGAMKDAPNKFWATWQKKHKQRIKDLETNEKAETL